MNRLWSAWNHTSVGPKIWSTWSHALYVATEDDQPVFDWEVNSRSQNVQLHQPEAFSFFINVLSSVLTFYFGY